MRNGYLFDEYKKNLVINTSCKHRHDKGAKVKLEK